MTETTSAVMDDGMFATVEDAKDFALKLKKKFLDCRVNRHGAWIDKDVRPDIDNILVIEQVCPSCGTSRKCERSRVSGRRLTGWAYTYPEGYQTKGIGRLAGDALDILALVKFEDVIARNTNQPNPLRRKAA